MSTARDELVRKVADELPVAIWVARAPSGEFVYANQLFAEILGTAARDDVKVGGYSEPYGIRTRDGRPYPEDKLPFVLALQQKRTIVVDDLTIRRPDGHERHVRATARPLMDANGEIDMIAVAFIDVTREVVAERARAEADSRLAQAQRMESIGQLAGGIAHDFNNLLATIRIVASTLRMDEPNPARAESLAQIDQVTESAVKLTRALLGFAGRGRHLTQKLSLGDLARRVHGILARTVDKRIEVALDTRDSLAVTGDPSQLEQVLMNLAVNARDAMAEGGRLEIRVFDERALDGAQRVILEVADTGTGIDPSIRARVFEPYFTTKTSGPVQGTGLGLATVYGIVDTHGGHIEIRDNAPQGTVMRVSLPAVDGAPDQRPVTPARPSDVLRGTGTILLVDDEAHVRQSTQRGLESLGYKVLAAADGVEAIQLQRASASEVRAVVLDLVMPRMDGAQCWAALQREAPRVPVLLTSGFALNEEAQKLLDLGARAFVTKPYDLSTLSRALAKALGT